MNAAMKLKMPVKTDEQINNIAAYYATQAMPASVEEDTYRKGMAAKCDRCHNPPSGQRNRTRHRYAARATITW